MGIFRHMTLEIAIFFYSLARDLRITYHTKKDF